MRRLSGRVGRAVLGSILRAIPGTVPTARAHPLDELLQILYVTPTTTGISIELHLNPGVLVAPAFAALVDPNADGDMSDDEKTAHLATVHDAITVTFDGEPVAVLVTDAIYPSARLLRDGGGTIMVFLYADLPNPEVAECSVSVTNAYSPMKTVMQGVVTLSPGQPIAVSKIERSNEGQMLSFHWSRKPVEAK